MTAVPTFVWFVGGALLLVILFVVAFKLMWRVARPNEALVISGRQRNTAADEPDSMSFRIVTGGGTLVIPLIETAEVLDLSLSQVSPTVDCPTNQGVQVGVKGVVIFKIGDDQRSIANAARRFLNQQDQMSKQIEEVFAGQLRSIVGGMTVEDMISDRTRLTAETRDACAREAQSLGLVIDSLQIQEIKDPTGYIDNIAQPNLARVRQEARVAQAQADQVATAAEQRSEIANAEARRDTALKTAAIQAEVEARQAEASQQGPLAEATARQKVLEQEAALAQRQVAIREQQLRADVQATADANAYATRVNAEADREAAVLRAQGEAETTRVKGAAQAEADKAKAAAEAEGIRLKGEAEGAALEARGKGLAAQQDAVIAQINAENLPEVVRAAASAMSESDLTIFNGADGVQQLLVGLVTQGTKLLEAVRGNSSAPSNGASVAPAVDSAPVNTGEQRVD